MAGWGENEEPLLGDDNGGENEMEKLRQSLGRVSTLLQARKAAKNWHQRSTKHLGKSDEEQQLQLQREVEDEQGSKAEWRIKLGEALESTPTHVIIVSLLLIDLLATAVDLLLTIHNTSADLRECSQSLRVCNCSPEDFSRREPWEFLHWISVGILFVLLLNVLGLMLAFGFSFFKHPGYILDLFVVVSALVLELCFEADTAGLLIILNLWRIVRVAHGIFEVTDEAWENEIDEMKERLESAEASYQRQCQLKDEHISRLEARLSELE